MKTMQVTLLNLPNDLLREIVVRLVRSSYGARSFAQAITSCKAIREFVFDEQVLRSVRFDDLAIHSDCKLFRHVEGLVVRCAQAGHTEAQVLLAKIIIMSFPLLNPKDRDLRTSSSATPMCSFLRHFMPPNKCNGGARNLLPLGNLLHFDLVKLFVSHAKRSDIDEISPYMGNYMWHLLKIDLHEMFLPMFWDLANLVGHLGAMTVLKMGLIHLGYVL